MYKCTLYYYDHEQNIYFYKPYLWNYSLRRTIIGVKNFEKCPSNLGSQLLFLYCSKRSLRNVFWIWDHNCCFLYWSQELWEMSFKFGITTVVSLLKYYFKRTLRNVFRIWDRNCCGETNDLWETKRESDQWQLVMTLRSGTTSFYHDHHDHRLQRHSCIYATKMFEGRSCVCHGAFLDQGQSKVHNDHNKDNNPCHELTSTFGKIKLHRY